jgi:hypothetical protein
MKNIGFQMNQIAVNQFAILAPEPPAGDISVELSVQFKTDIVNKGIAVVFGIRFSHNDALLLLLEIQCEFKIKPEDWDGLILDGEVVIPVYFLRHIALHTVGTARGVLFCKTEGTPFNKFILPPVNLESMINQDVRIPLRK